MRRPTARPARRLGTGRPARRLGAGVAALILGTLLVPSGVPPAESYPGTHVRLEGAGWGHGRGMGQHGALGYALNHGWSYTQILDHFYGNTTMGNINNPVLRVRLTAFDGRDTIATGASGVTVPGVGTFGAVLVRQINHSGTYRVWALGSASTCGGNWGNPIADVGGNVDIHPAAGGEANLVQACLPTGSVRWYRGHLRASRDSEGPQRTVNVVDMEGYLRGVVPRESPASWGDLGGGQGMHALRAQAVAARSYARAENRYSYAETCDTTACQVYGGYRDSTFGVREHPRTNQAIAETAGQVRMRGGAVQRTEFSSSTGGHTAGGTFPPVVDLGDSVANNPNHRWSASVPVSSVEAAFPHLGTLRSVDVTRRNGLGVWGGRVLEVVLRGSTGNQTLTGNELRSRFGLKSDWFRVISCPAGGVRGYWVLDTVGGVFTFGDAPYLGSVPELRNAGHNIGPAQAIDITATPSGNGYWILDEVGGMFTFGDSRFFGSVPGLRDQGIAVGPARIIALAPTPSGKGYWILDDVGGMFAFGDAQFFGSVPGLRQAGVAVGPARVVAMTPTSTGKGYWILDEFGGVFAFGDAQFYGSIPALREQGVSIGQADVVEIAASKAGYWMVDAKGGMFAFGDARFHGSLPGAGIQGTAVGFAATRDDDGYLIVTFEDADVHAFGSAPDCGGAPDVGVATRGQGIAIRWQ